MTEHSLFFSEINFHIPPCRNDIAANAGMQLQAPLALAQQFGHVEITQLLMQAGGR